MRAPKRLRSNPRVRTFCVLPSTSSQYTTIRHLILKRPWNRESSLFLLLIAGLGGEAPCDSIVSDEENSGCRSLILPLFGQFYGQPGGVCKLIDSKGEQGVQAGLRRSPDE